MDIDVIERSVKSLMDFKAKVEGMMHGADGNVEKATDQLDGLLAFKSEVQGMLPQMMKATTDIAAIVSDIAEIKKQLEPALAWIAAASERHTDAAADKAVSDAGTAENSGA